ncbi:DUF4246 domain-containing protein [Aspergillus brunneoviolaceus CBS 621.78]|uniref:Uncharacterized protein n=1 Tax=Aspergillus brunneoviolaceus CBS 621.78 TaxID=1450534 RepID=A0ACD1G550_9EURO|nr:hypothetical protein BO95DRAFT_515458 [Aspergillus brunneoviolaceus CBS 621.78]RAH44414.1 hypothetical protein BO95DRAFT_515458 [Aspergillus brunneoviolaceus CBS 621.78]
MSSIQFDNTENRQLQVPGFHDIPVDYELPVGQRFAHGALPDWTGSRGRAIRLTQPEIFMLRIIEMLTERQNWEVDVFDEDIIQQWYREILVQFQARSGPEEWGDMNIDLDLITSKTWDWCIAELRDKAVSFREKDYIITLNADSGVCKSAVLVNEDLQKELQAAFQPLLQETPGYHDLVDPDLYMLIYGRTAVLSQGGQVTMTAAGISYPTTSSDFHVAPSLQHPIDIWTTQHGRPPRDDSIGSLYRWSHRFQWLPCEVEFVSSEGTNVRITSYINNLHPRNGKAYAMIEKLISACIEPWNDILIRDPCKDWPGPTWAMDCEKIKQYLATPEPDLKFRIIDDDPSESIYPKDLLGFMTPEMWKSVEQVQEVVSEKRFRLHSFQYPEPGVYTPTMNHNHQYQSVCLQNQFRNQGLQVIVRVSSIELTAEQTIFSGDNDYHIDGLLNEHIVATARYYYDVENITEARISFQQEVDLDAFEITLEPHAMQKIFGLPREDEDPATFGDAPPKLQTLGSVTTIHQGCFLAWPNTLRYRTLPFSLQDPYLSGHQRFITIWLVDPHYRICSSRNVPPQQHAWWREDTMLDRLGSQFGLPQELRDLIIRATEDWPMGLDEAVGFKEQSAVERERAICAQSQGVRTHDFWLPIRLGEQG